MQEQWITSVGIDLGTSTTKFIVSRLRLAKVSSLHAVPRYQIVERRLVYASPVRSTPLRNEDEIDVAEVSRMLEEEYRNAGIRPHEIKSGAVIITGETATKRNAEQILHFLAERSGDFVVATAGADLESLLAGKGSGAEARSRTVRGVIANIDIGGGTANVALFERGRMIGTVTFHIGGRLIRLTPEGEIRYVSPQLLPWLQANGIVLEKGKRVGYEQLETISFRLHDSMFSYLTGKRDSSAKLLLVAEPSAAGFPPIDEVMISGGVGQLMREPKPADLAETARHGDFGPLLAHAIEPAAARYPFRLVPAEQTVRATVIGAGMQSTEISGATVHIAAERLPIRNVPVLTAELSERDTGDPQALAGALRRVMETAARLYDAEASPPFALAITGLRYCSYHTLSLLADVLHREYTRVFPRSSLMVIICENDMAKALGQSLAIRCRGNPQVICIDQVRVEHGDYIDLGQPIAPSEIIPVVVKTLAFLGKDD